MKKECSRCHKLKEIPDDKTTCSTCHLKNELQKLREQRRQNQFGTQQSAHVGRQAAASVFPTSSTAGAAGAQAVSPATSVQSSAGASSASGSGAMATGNANVFPTSSTAGAAGAQAVSPATSVQSSAGASSASGSGAMATGNAKGGILALIKVPAAKVVFPLLACLILIAPAIWATTHFSSQKPVIAPTATAEISATSTSTPGATPTNAPGATPTSALGATSTSTPGATLTNTSGATPTNAPGATPTNALGATLTNVPTPTPTPTPTPAQCPISSTYDDAVAANGMMFGFDACHTRTNPYEHVISSTNVTGLSRAWFHTTNWAVTASPVVANGTVYIGSTDGTMYALDAVTGASKWQFSTNGQTQQTPGPGNSQIWSTAAVADGVVYFGVYYANPSSNGDVYALDAVTGNPKWKFHTNGVVESSPTVVNGVVYIGSFDNNLYAIDAATGLQKWSFLTGNFVYSSPAVVGNVVYIGSADGKVYALDAITGQLKWSYYTGKGIYSSPAVVNNVVYVGTAQAGGGTYGSGDVHALDATTGIPIWQQPFPIGGEILSSPAVAHGIVYIGSYNNNVYAIDATTGQQKWSYLVDSHIWYSSPVVANGIVYIGSIGAYVYAFDAVSGQLLQKFQTSRSGSIEGSPVVANGMLYVGTNDRNMYAYHLPN